MQQTQLAPMHIEGNPNERLRVAEFAQVSLELRERVAHALAMAEKLHRPETFLAATVSFRDLDMLSCLRRSFRRYESALSAVESSVRAWRRQLCGLSRESITQLEYMGAPIGELSAMLGRDWHENRGEPRSDGQQGSFFEELQTHLESLSAAFCNTGLAAYR